MDSFELLKSLKKRYKIPSSTPFWWRDAGSFKVVVETILIQRTKWENVEKSIYNLSSNNLLKLEKLAFIDEVILQNLIQSSGFYRQKAKNLKLLCKNILYDFENFENFTLSVDRDWLLKQKGLGKESSDAILNYACKREVFVVDSYLNRLLIHFGFCFEEYDEIYDWVVSGLHQKVYSIYPEEMSLAQIYARFHGKIVMFCKDNMKGSNIKLTPEEILSGLYD